MVGEVTLTNAFEVIRILKGKNMFDALSEKLSEAFKKLSRNGVLTQSAVDDAMREIEDNNPRLKGILPKNYARKELDKRRLGDVVDLFTNIEMLSAGDEKDLLGRAYEYCLMKFASMEGKNAGEFYPPSCIVCTIVEILKPYRGRWRAVR